MYIIFYDILVRKILFSKEMLFNLISSHDYNLVDPQYFFYFYFFILTVGENIKRNKFNF